jgi:alpha-N-arabinofuranosidase
MGLAMTTNRFLMTRLATLALSVAVGLPSGQAAAQPPDDDGPRALVNIDTGAPTSVYNRMIFGGFLEHFGHQVYGGVFDPGSTLADADGFRTDVLAALAELRTPVVRWPGGCFVSGYHWKLGVGQPRRPTDDMAWGVVEPNTFGTDEYVKLCHRLGWTPYICTNAGNGTIPEMVDWVRYCNADTGDEAQHRRTAGHDRPLGVPIWSIGNENYHPTEIGHKPIEQWAPFVAQAARAMKAADPTIQLTAAAQATREWTLPLLQAAGPDLDYISIHSYWLPLWEENRQPDYLTCILESEGPERSLADFLKILDESGYRGKIKVAYDEWNLRSWHHPGFPRTTVQDYDDPQVAALVRARDKNEIASQYTLADALFTASFYNACLRHADFAMANIAPLVNTRGPLFVHPGGIVRRTHFHTMAMYANTLQPRVGSLALEADPLANGDRSVPVADAVATVDETGRHWAIALVNRHPDQPLACTVRFGDRLLEGTYDATILAGDSPDAFNDVEHPTRVVPKKTRLTFDSGLVHLPAHSLTVVQVEQAPETPRP